MLNVLVLLPLLCSLFYEKLFVHYNIVIIRSVRPPQEGHDLCVTLT